MKKSLLVIAMLLVICSPVFSQPPSLAVTRELADQGHADAQFNLGIMYEADRDYAEAVRWFRLSAEQGQAEAQFNLGSMYVRGRGVLQNDAEAVKWFRLAAEQGYASAQANLGHRYATGTGVPQDSVRAYLWFSMAAAQGFEGASEARDRASERLSVDERNSAQQLVTRCFDSGFKQCE